MAVKMNLTIMTKNHAADPEIGFLAKSISKSNGCATAMPTAWELRGHFGPFLNYSELSDIDLILGPEVIG